MDYVTNCLSDDITCQTVTMSNSKVIRMLNVNPLQFIIPHYAYIHVHSSGNTRWDAVIRGLNSTRLYDGVYPVTAEDTTLAYEKDISDIRDGRLFIGKGYEGVCVLHDDANAAYAFSETILSETSQKVIYLKSKLSHTYLAGHLKVLAEEGVMKLYTVDYKSKGSIVYQSLKPCLEQTGMTEEPGTSVNTAPAQGTSHATPSAGEKRAADLQYTSDMQNLLDDLTNCKEDRSRLDEQITILEYDVQNCETQRTALQVDIELMNDTIARMHSEHAGLQTQLAEGQKDANAKIAELEDRVASHMEQINHANAIGKLFAIRLQDATDEIVLLKAQIKDRNARIEQLDKELHDQQQSYAKLSGEVDNIKRSKTCAGRNRILDSICHIVLLYTLNTMANCRQIASEPVH